MKKKRFLTCPHHCLNRCADWVLPLQCFQSAPSGGGTESHPSKPLALPIPLIVCEEIITNGGGGREINLKLLRLESCARSIFRTLTQYTLLHRQKNKSLKSVMQKRKHISCTSDASNKTTISQNSIQKERIFTC